MLMPGALDLSPACVVHRPREVDALHLGADRRRELSQLQCMHAPPSTTSVWPVMKSLSAEAKKATAPTRSSGVCMRCSALVEAAAWRYFTMSSPAFSSESVLPGAMQLTQMLSLPTSIASVRVKPRMPALEVT